MPESPLRIVFMGTPEFAVPSLERLIADGYAIVGVYTQADRPAGRSGTPVSSPVKRAALRHGTPVFQPRSLRRPQEQGRLREMTPDLIVLAAYGLLLPQEVLDIPPHGGLNVHPSLLPRHRGASPVVGALLAGDSETGVSIMLMDAGMDTGAVLAQRRLPIAPEDTAGSLTAKLAQLGQELLSDTIPRWTRREIAPRPQNEEQATYTRLLTKDDGRIDWSQPAALIARQVRAYQPWPGSFTNWQGRQLKVLEAETQPSGEVIADVGTVVQPEGSAVAVQTGEGLLLLRKVQQEGRKALLIQEFLRGARGFVGSRLRENIS